MQKLNPPTLQNLQGSEVNDERPVIPIGPRFQADIPDWTGPPHTERPHNNEGESSSSRWLGTRVWPINSGIAETNGNVIGKGRPDLCPCQFPGSVECIKRHVTDKRTQLQYELGPAFWKWKFDEMGEEVSKSWTMEEQKKFESLVKTNPMSKGKSFMKPALTSLRCQSRKSIVSYYFNVHVPKRMSMQTRSGCKIVDTDDEESGAASNSRVPPKRSRAKSNSPPNSKYMKTRYLTGQR